MIFWLYHSFCTFLVLYFYFYLFSTLFVFIIYNRTLFIFTLSLIWPFGAPSSWLLSSFNMPVVLWALLASTTRCFRVTLHSTRPSPGMSDFFKNSWFLLLENGFVSCSLNSKSLSRYWISLLQIPLSRHLGNRYMW